uniref:Uncharacterized protein n=1 Tax=Rhizophora mucronata TaxID=61149 RepID=A0A2P2N1B9_RHIMU
MRKKHPITKMNKVSQQRFFSFKLPEANAMPELKVVVIIMMIRCVY